MHDADVAAGIVAHVKDKALGALLLQGGQVLPEFVVHVAVKVGNGDVAHVVFQHPRGHAVGIDHVAGDVEGERLACTFHHNGHLGADLALYQRCQIVAGFQRVHIHTGSRQQLVTGQDACQIGRAAGGDGGDLIQAFGSRAVGHANAHILIGFVLLDGGRLLGGIIG